MTNDKNNDKKETQTGYGKDVIYSVLFMVLMIIGMIILAHFRP